LITYMDGYPYKGFYFLLNYNEGIHKDFERLITWMVLETPEDFDKLLSRYMALPTQVDQIISLMSEGVLEGLVYHDISMKGINENLERFIVETPEDSPLYESFVSMPGSIAEEEANEFRNLAKQII
ncbi:unnamed protein product, partial [Meganyctiphanes norvegica]